MAKLEGGWSAKQLQYVITIFSVMDTAVLSPLSIAKTPIMPICIKTTAGSSAKSKATVGIRQFEEVKWLQRASTYKYYQLFRLCLATG